MAIVKAFKGVRPNAALVCEIAALPYDVYSRAEATEIVLNNPHSFLKIDRGETTLGDSVGVYDDVVYENAKNLFDEMLDKGDFIQDEQAVFYVYELTRNGRPQTGLVACTAVEEYKNHTIKEHELTRELKEKDRIRHVDTVNAHTGPIFMTYKHRVGISDVIKKWKESHEAVYDFLADDQVRHVVWKIDEPMIIEAITKAFKEIESFYIADGHHRAASAVKVSDMRDKDSKTPGVNEHNYFLSVIFPDDELEILSYNRVVKDLYGLSTEQFIQHVEEQFTIEKTSSEAFEPTEKGTFTMFLEGKWYLLKAMEGSYHAGDPVLGLDVSILQLNLLAPILGIGDPRTDKRVDFIGGIRGLKEIEKRCRKDMTVGFALVPTSIEELMKISDEGELMPPKSTWFEPKLRSGIFCHLLEES